MVRQEPGPGYLIGVFIANQAECLDAMGRYESAVELYDQALEVARESGDRPSLAANIRPARTAGRDGVCPDES